MLRLKSSPKVIIFKFALNSAEHGIFSANKYENANYAEYENANNSGHFHIY